MVAATPYVPDRGDVIWITFSPQAGHEQAGRRPALVISPANYNSTLDLCVCCPITSQRKNYPFEITIPQGFAVTGVVLSDQMKCQDWKARNAVFLCRLPNSVVRSVLKMVAKLVQ